MSQLVRFPRLPFRPISWPRRSSLFAEARRASLLVTGALLAAFAFAVFQAPYNLAAGGIAGVGLIVNEFTGWPIGLTYFLLNIPLMAFGFKNLGRWPFVARTAIAAALFALFIDLFAIIMPRFLTPFPPTDDVLLSAIYGGVLGGIGGGLIYRAGSTMGGTGIVARWLQQKTGQPLSQTYLFTDGGILLALGLVFGWSATLYGLLMLFINGMASDFILEGPSRTRVATVVTDQPQKLVAAFTTSLGRGVSYWEVTGGYTGARHTLITCTISRSQVTEVKRLVAQIDPDAFVSIGVSHEALGGGFATLKEPPA